MLQEPINVPLFHRFELRVDGELALLEYRQQGEDVLVFTHTFVPEALRGRNLAAVLTRFALEEARRLGKKVKPQCSYVDAFMKRHPEYADLRA
ncbi:MAG: GNAT family N-acetyltransferase [Desulfobulbus sp.]|jgi:predicted GNAT family acetyltransferase